MEDKGTAEGGKGNVREESNVLHANLLSIFASGVALSDRRRYIYIS